MARKRLGFLLAEFLAPAVEHRIGDAQVFDQLHSTFAAGLEEPHSFQFEFACKLSLLDVHNPLPRVWEDTILLFHDSMKSGQVHIFPSSRCFCRQRERSSPNWLALRAWGNWSTFRSGSRSLS
jgi:hypothetical protein